MKNCKKINAPRLKGALLDVIPRQLESIQLLDIGIVAENTQIFKTYETCPYSWQQAKYRVEYR